MSRYYTEQNGSAWLVIDSFTKRPIYKGHFVTEAGARNHAEALNKAYGEARAAA